MNRFRSWMMCALALIAAQNAVADKPSVFGISFFRQRSQGTNEARWMAGQAHHLYLPDVDCLNGSIAFIPEYGNV